jgi:hypothetical protein
MKNVNGEYLLLSSQCIDVDKSSVYISNNETRRATRRD